MPALAWPSADPVGRAPVSQPTPGQSHVVEVSDDTYQVEVVSRSLTLPVLVEVWAQSCESCSQLSPVLERLAKDSAGAWVLARVDADANPELRALLEVRRIPAVAAVVRGRMIDGFYGNPAEPDLRRWIGCILQIARQLRL